MKIYNNNPAFGDCGPFDVDAPTFKLACFELANEMESNFKERATEQEYSGPGSVMFTPSERGISARIRMMRSTFISGLTQILHCDECGKDYHKDAPERGHADGCSARRA